MGRHTATVRYSDGSERRRLLGDDYALYWYTCGGREGGPYHVPNSATVLFARLRYRTNDAPAELKTPQHLGGSEIAAVLGLSPFQTAAGLWDEKMGLVEPKPTSDAMWVGIYLEDGIAKLWAHRHAEKVKREYTLRKHKPKCHPEHKFMRASPDRIISFFDPEFCGFGQEGVEIKCISDFSAKAGAGSFRQQRVPRVLQSPVRLEPDDLRPATMEPRCDGRG